MPQPIRFTNVDNILTAARSSGDIPSAIQQITSVLRERHHLRATDPNDFNVRDMTEVTKAMSSTTELITKLLLCVAMISLVVGGVGIMNIMLVSVTERTHEIGLRMAVGAEPGAILRQFLTEAVVLCLLGGAMGIILGRSSSFIISAVLHWPTATSVVAIVAAVIVSASVGVIFGFYPAWKASRLDPSMRCGMSKKALALIVLLMAGCMVGPEYHPPQTAAPDSWAGVAKTSKDQPSVATWDTVELTRWWQQFNDPILNELVEESVKANPNLQIAEARLRQARAYSGIAMGGLWPSVSASGSYQKFHTAGVTPDNQTKDLFQSGLDAVWEMDLFGGIRRNVESANANVQAAIENIRDVQVSLIAEVATDYVQLRLYQQEIVVAQNNLTAQQHTADITRKLFKAGFDSALDVANAESVVATTEAQIPVFETSAKQSIYALSVLLARPPAALLEKLSPTVNLPAAPPKIPAGMPSGLLRRRPDIREAEAQLHAATAQTGVAIAQLFPSFSLTGTVNSNSNLLRTWWNNTNRSFSVGPSLNWPVFQGGAIISNVRLQEALLDQAFITYEETVLSAFQDVENALIAFANEQEHRKSLTDAVAANRKAVDLSLQLYTAGQIDFLNVLVAQTSLYTSENALAQSEGNIIIDLIALYKALGGGWESVENGEK